MEKIVVRGGKRLKGTVKISGSKNAVLPIIAASLLAENGVSMIQDVPELDDVTTICQLLKSLGIHVKRGRNVLAIDAVNLRAFTADYDCVRKMRASFLVMGPLLARLGTARIALPGGCAIGTRPIDQHLKGFEAMGVKIKMGHGYIEAHAEHGLKGAKIYLDVPSVGATENIMMAAALAQGVTVIENTAKEPEIVDLANFLNAMGAKVRGAGTGMIRIEGVKRLSGAAHAVIPDRVEAGTYMIAAAITGGDITLEGIIADHLTPVISKLQEMGVLIEERENAMRVWAPDSLRAVDVKTLPYPGFPTDMQAQMMALLAVTQGASMITETVFENRFLHVAEFKNMNANIKVESRTAVITGHPLSGAKVCATDLRAGAALVLAALAADGDSEITGIQHIDRGYVDITGKLRALGAEVQRIEPEEAKDAVREIGDFAVLSAQPTLA